MPDVTTSATRPSDAAPKIDQFLYYAERSIKLGAQCAAIDDETIYRSLFIQARGVLKKELIQHLRTKRRIRRSRHSRVRGHRMGQIVDAISIRERPAEVEDRAIPGLGLTLRKPVLAEDQQEMDAAIVEDHWSSRRSIRRFARSRATSILP